MVEKIEALKEQIEKLPQNNSGRRKYPAAIRKAICKMIDDGVGMNELAMATGIHVTTLHYWRRPRKKGSAGFNELSVIAPLPEPHHSPSEIQVLFASGTRVSGLNIADLADLFRQGLIL
jgi:transposase-like protein